ncbi:xanthine dehydrogenase family protein molybdopterin-binding subunit [Alphaproteobacteria bacterium]|nr:xanthine dehydrogenase family protein molybdopterin-binding subunit [Alphaproteobacteria bacterium]
MKFGIGQPLKRLEDERFLTGSGTYNDDINFQGQVYMHIVRSPFSFAKIIKINSKKAQEYNGVITILNHDIIKSMNINPMYPGFTLKNKDGTNMTETYRNILADKKVRYVGEPVLAIIGETNEIAEEAADLIEIEYEEIISTTNLKNAIKQNAPIVREELPDNICFDWELGDKENVDEALNSSHHITEIELINNRLVPNPMECRSATAKYDNKTDSYNLYCSSQGVHSLKKKLAIIFNINENKVNVFTPDVGGGFGMKIFNYPEYVLTLAAAKITNKPIKWKANRSESFLSDIHGRDHFSKAKLGFDKYNKITALKVETFANMGAYLSDFGVFIPTYAGTAMLTGCYKIPRAYANVKGVFTNTNPVDAYRGAGRPEAAYLIERLIDKSARELKTSPLELRKENLIKKHEMPYKTALGHTYDSGDFEKNLFECLENSDYKSFETRKEESLKKNKYRGIGISTYIEACGGGGPEYCSLKIGGNGNVEVKIGTQSNGQGHSTSYAQIVSEVLEINTDEINVIQGNSIEIAKGSGTGGSRSMPVGGNALYIASKNFLETTISSLAKHFKTNANEIKYKSGVFTFKNKSVSLSDLTQLFKKNDLEINADWAPSPSTYTFPNGTHICELEIDKYLGTIKIIRYTIVDDFGKVINPLLLEGQVHGGIAQGIGQALFEEAIYDDITGQLVNGSFMDYAIPRASDMPFMHFSFNEILCTTNPLGIKGAGEAGAIGAPPAVINAVCNALDIEHIDMPAKPEKIWKILSLKQLNKG